MNDGSLTALARFRFMPLGMFFLCLLVGVSLLFPVQGLGKIHIDINAPSIRKFNIAVPDFQNLGETEDRKLGANLSEVLCNDLKLSGYFHPMDKEAFLEEEGGGLTFDSIRFKDWSVIGAELLLKAGYVLIGQTVEVEYRLFDVFWGRQILGRRALGDRNHYRRLMHRVGNEIIRSLTDQEGIFLTKLAFVGNATGHKEIYVSDYDGYNAHQITRDQSIALLPRWSPNGHHLLYNSYKDGSPMLYMRDVEAGTVRRISSRSGLNIGAAWAPGGDKLALTLSGKGDPDIYTIDLEGNVLEHLTSYWGIDVSPTFSPDGKKMAFVSSRSGSPQVYVLDFESGTKRRLTFEGNYNTSPAWSSLNRIAFVSMEEGRFDICTINPDGTARRKLTHDQGQNEDPCWSPDGRYIAFSSNRRGRYHLYIMNANGQNQSRITSMKGDQTAPSWGP